MTHAPKFKVCSIWALLACGAAIVFAAYPLASAKAPSTSSPGAKAPDASVEPINFSRDIRPILSDRCFLCHGPDEGAREADLRLDQRADATRNRDGLFAIRPGDPDRSELIKRIAADDPDVRMPPADSHKKPLTADETELVRRWIAEGAQWSGHWAFDPPRRPGVPDVAGVTDSRNPIDAFIAQRLQREGLRRSPEADKATLLRRLSLDLIGLPPTIEEVDAYLADEGPDAYARQVERLLASPHFGERWGRIWLDAARYADSDGFEKDMPREVWFYRDWVINALNRDMPYDQFVIEQMAGDLLPNATQDQIVATGFLRNSMLNEEGGIDPEQFRMEAMFDRMDALGKAVLGFTVQCAQCHTHKYDPIQHDDYYRMLALMNNCYERQMIVYTPTEREARERILRQIAKIEDELRREDANWRDKLAAWEATVRDDQPQWTVLSIENAGDNAQRYTSRDDGSLLAQGYSPPEQTALFSAETDLPEIRSFRLETLTDPVLPAGGPGRGTHGLLALTEFQVQVASKKAPNEKIWVKFVRASADFSNERRQLGPRFAKRNGPPGFTGPVQYAIDDDPTTAWGIDAGPGRRNADRKAVFVADRNIAFPEGSILTFHLAQQHGGFYEIKIVYEAINLGRFRISATGTEAEADPLPSHVRAIFAVPPGDRTDEQQQALFSYWRTTVADWKEANAHIERLWRQHPEGATQLVLQERETPRKTYRLDRGDFLKPVEPVRPGVPKFLHPWPADAPPTRLNFARWLVDRQSPTAARVIVNRLWQAYFGTGLVSTSDDFGSQGALPTHPQLLDWLAVELMDRQWSLKHLHRLIVFSATYRQSSVSTDEQRERDPDNLLLARAPRLRVDAELVRDIHLAASGLLNPQVGGPSVFPPAPLFLFQRPISFGPKPWELNEGPNRYRRGLYTFRYRSVPYPAIQVFDAPSGEFAVVRRSRSNTPLQALTTLNEPLFVECARALAKRTVLEGGVSDRERLVYAFRRCLSRNPTAEEVNMLLGVLQEQLAWFRDRRHDPASVLGGENGVSSATPRSAAELAAWTVISRVLLNLDETITKE